MLCVTLKNQIASIWEYCTNLWKLSTVHDIEVKRTVHAVNETCRKILIAFVVLAVLAVLGMSSSPIFYGRSLVLGKYNYSDSYGLHALCLITQEVGLLAALISVTAIDMIYIGTCTTLAIHFKILGCYLKETINDGRFNENLGNFIEYHNLLFR